MAGPMQTNSATFARKQRLDQFLEPQKGVTYDPRGSKCVSELLMQNGGQGHNTTALPTDYTDSLPMFCEDVLETSSSQMPVTSSYQQSQHKTVSQTLKKKSKKAPQRTAPYDQSHRIHSNAQTSQKLPYRKSVQYTQLQSNHIKMGATRSLDRSPVTNVGKNPSPPQRAAHQHSTQTVPPYTEPVGSLGSYFTSRWTGCLPLAPKPISPVKLNVNQVQAGVSHPVQNTPASSAVRLLPFDARVTKGSKFNTPSHVLPKHPPKSKTSNQGKPSSSHKKKSAPLPIAVRNLCKTKSNTSCVLDIELEKKKKVHLSKLKHTSSADRVSTNNGVSLSTDVYQASDLTSDAKVTAKSNSQSKSDSDKPSVVHKLAVMNKPNSQSNILHASDKPSVGPKSAVMNKPNSQSDMLPANDKQSVGPKSAVMNKPNSQSNMLHASDKPSVGPKSSVKNNPISQSNTLHASDPSVVPKSVVKNNANNQSNIYTSDKPSVGPKSAVMNKPNIQPSIHRASGKPSIGPKSAMKNKPSKTKSKHFVSSLINRQNQPLVMLVPLKKTQELADQANLICNNLAGVSQKQAVNKINTTKMKQTSSQKTKLAVMPVAIAKNTGQKDQAIIDKTAIKSPVRKEQSCQQKSKSRPLLKDVQVELPIAVDKIKSLIAEKNADNVKSMPKTKSKLESSLENGAHPVTLTKVIAGDVTRKQSVSLMDSDNDIVETNEMGCSLSSSNEKHQPVTSSNQPSSESTPQKRVIPKLKTRGARLLENANRPSSVNGRSPVKISEEYQIIGEDTQTVIHLVSTMDGHVIVSPESEESQGILEFVSTTRENQDATRVMVLPLTCHICMLSFHSFDRYMQHKWSHRGIRRWCPRYRKQPTKKSTPKKQLGYVVIPQNPRPHMCEFCGKNFVRRRDVIVHLRVHTGEKPFICDLCNKGFSQKSQLKRHVDSHLGEKPFACELCENRYSRKDGLKRHMVTHSGLRPYSCNLCGATFTYSSTLGEHMAQHRGDRPHKCSYCPQTFIKKIRLTEHERIHTGIKPFVCHICNAGFTATRLLNSHKKIHAEVRPFTCNICQKGFTQNGALTKHMGCHSNEKPWKCSECGKGFAQQQYLKNHMKVHSDIKPYKCVHCGWGFRDKTSHVRHERLHTGVRPYKCDRCEKSFNRSTHLNKHMACHKKYDAIKENNLMKMRKQEESNLDKE